MNRLYKSMLLIVMTIFGAMYGAATEEEITLPAPDKTKLQKVKNNYRDKQDYQETSIIHFLKQFNEKPDECENEKQVFLFKIIHTLITQSPDRVNIPDRQGASPLYYATKLDLEAFAALFIVYGATLEDPSDPYYPLKAETNNHRGGKTRKLITDYINAGDKEAFRKQLEKRFAIPDLKFSEKRASQSNIITISYDASKLENARKTLAGTTEKNVGNLLHYLETRGADDNEHQFLLFEIIHNLIKKNPASVNIPDGGGYSPLYNAMRFDLEAFAAIFIAYGAEMPTDRNNEHHPLKADKYATRNERTIKLIVDYTKATDKAAFSKQIQQRLKVPGIDLFESHIKDNSISPEKTQPEQIQPQPEPQQGQLQQTQPQQGQLQQTQPQQDQPQVKQQPQSTQGSTSDTGNAVKIGLLAVAALCSIAGIAYALRNKTQSPPTHQPDIEVAGQPSL